MTHPSIYARTVPNKIAYQMAGTGKAITYRELDELSNQGAQLFRALGLKEGDHIAFLIENRLAFMEICWAAQRAGLYYTAISRYLTKDEIAHIIRDCGAKVFITSPKCAEQVRSLVDGEPGGPLFFMVDEPEPGFRSWDKEAIAMPTTPIADEVAGYDMLYSSGTTGRPKGVLRAVFPRVFSGRHCQHPAVWMSRAPWADLAFDREFQAFGDGESLVPVPITGRRFEAVPLAVRAVAPALAETPAGQQLVLDPADPEEAVGDRILDHPGRRPVAIRRGRVVLQVAAQRRQRPESRPVRRGRPAVLDRGSRRDIQRAGRVAHPTHQPANARSAASGRRNR